MAASPAVVHAPSLRELQVRELELLREIARRCESAGLRWFVIGGTLLGAAREQGFIPWDDDLDVGLPRPDYERFAAGCREALEPGFAWVDAIGDPTYPYAYGKLVLTDPDHRVDRSAPGRERWDAPFVDVFPIDGAPGSRLGRAVHAAALKLAVTSIGARIPRDGVRRLLAVPLRAVPRRLALAVLDGLARRFPFATSRSAVNAAGAWGYRRECQPVERFVPTAGLEFEGLTVPAPGGWEAYLDTMYGDWRRPPPVEARRPRHAPVDRLVAAEPGATGPASGPGVAAAGQAGGARPGVVVAALGTLVVRAGFLVGRLRPPRPTVVLATRDVAHPGGNLVAIRDELDRRLPEVRVRLVGYRMRGGIRGRLTTVVEAFVVGYHLAASRLFVADDWIFPLFAAWPRRGTTRVQVWHAAGAFKKFGFSVLEQAPDGATATAALPMTANWDLCLVSSAAAAPHFAEAFRLPHGRLSSALGLPRTDAFYDAELRARVAEAVRGRYDLRPGRRVLLYAPTFRGASVRDARHPGLADLVALRDALASDWVLLLRLHPLVRSSLDVPAGLGGFVIDASDWPDLNELMLVADVLVTDFSSAVFDFSLLGRPIAVFAPDLESYEAERGFYLDIRRDLPGPVLESTADLVAWLRAGRFDLDAVRAFAATWFDVADGRAAARFVDRVVVPALAGAPLAIEPRPRPGERVVEPVPPA